MRRSIGLSLPALALAVGLLALPAPDAAADLILDSGTPDRSTNYSVFADPATGQAQFLAQGFSLSDTVHVGSIEVYVGTYPDAGTVTVDISTAIRSGASASDLLASFDVVAPVVFPNGGGWVATAVDLLLGPGSYYAVFSAGSDGVFLPLRAPNLIGGNLFSAHDSGVDTTLPIASAFTSGGDPYGAGLRLSGDIVPEPSSIALLGLGALGLWVVRRRRKRGS